MMTILQLLRKDFFALNKGELAYYFVDKLTSILSIVKSASKFFSNDN